MPNPADASALVGPPPPFTPPAGAAPYGAPPPIPHPSNAGRTVAIIVAAAVAAVIGIAVVCIVAITFLGQKSSSKFVPVESASESGAEPSPGTGRDYPAQVRRNFMTSCALSGSQAQCACSLESIEQEYTLDEFVELEQHVVNSGTSGMPAQLRQILSDCASAG